jgi:hypothetical protein
MKKTLFLCVVFFATATAYGQKGTVSGHVSGPSPYLPMQGLQVFLYAADSSIAGSGVTDAEGYYETNRVHLGPYSVKVVYPTNKTTLVTGVQLKHADNTVNIRLVPPMADTIVAYSDLTPVAATKRSK